MRAVIVFILVSLAWPAIAQQDPVKGQRDTDVFFGASDLTDRLSGMMLEFYDGSTARYAADGSYAYIYQDGDPPFKGTWTVEDRGKVCVTFENGSDRCDHIVQNGDRMVLIIERGTRFPVRKTSALN